MEQMDSATIVAIVSVIGSVLTVFITVIFSSKNLKMELENQSKQKQFDLYYSEKSKVFEDFATAASTLVTNINQGKRYDDLYTSAHKSMLLCNTENKLLLKCLVSYVNEMLMNGGQPSKEWEFTYLEKLSLITLSLNEELSATANLIAPKRKWYTKLFHRKRK